MTQIKVDKAVVYAAVQTPYDPRLKLDKGVVYAAVQTDSKGNLYQGTAGNRPVFKDIGIKYIDFTGGKSFQFAAISAEQFNWLILKTDGLFEEGSFTTVVGLNTITVPNFCQMVLFPASYSYTNIYKEALKATMKARSPVVFSGGTITQYTSGGTTYRVHTFTADGTLQIPLNKNIDYLLVGGGGGGGRDGGGGGGGGGVLQGSLSSVSGSFPIVIGSGGVGTAASGTTGGNTTGLGFTALGGGGGGTGGSSGLTGGSGGGGGHLGGLGASGTSGQGFSGGNADSNQRGGGGGGAGAVGISGSISGNGGDGIQTSINGTPTYFGGGGGAGRWTGSPPGTGGLGGGASGSTGFGAANSAAANTGGGGGGRGDWNAGGGGNGGSGIAIIRYAI